MVSAENRGREFTFAKKGEKVAWSRKSSKGGHFGLPLLFQHENFFGKVRDSNPRTVASNTAGNPRQLLGQVAVRSYLKS